MSDLSPLYPDIPDCSVPTPGPSGPRQSWWRTTPPRRGLRRWCSCTAVSLQPGRETRRAGLTIKHYQQISKLLTQPLPLSSLSVLMQPKLSWFISGNPAKIFSWLGFINSTCHLHRLHCPHNCPRSLSSQTDRRGERRKLR